MQEINQEQQPDFVSPEHSRGFEGAEKHTNSDDARLAELEARHAQVLQQLDEIKARDAQKLADVRAEIAEQREELQRHLTDEEKAHVGKIFEGEIQSAELPDRLRSFGADLNKSFEEYKLLLNASEDQLQEGKLSFKGQSIHSSEELYQALSKQLSGVNGLLLGKIRFEVDKVLPADLQEKFAKNASGEINTNNYEFFAGKIDGKDLEFAANRVAQLLREAKPDNLALAEELDNNLKRLELAEQIMRVKQETLAITYAPKKKLDWRPREETGEQGELPNNRRETEALKSQKGNDYTADATLDQ